MLILEIAAGILLAFFILANFDIILKLIGTAITGAILFVLIAKYGWGTVAGTALMITVPVCIIVWLYKRLVPMMPPAFKYHLREFFADLKE
jgi:hypothetical protein